ncbi:uncharacterized protein [Prorops nasuta]|uniref:uncharacterized protein n=1 Tax=Prorops nasuta TaxID=863751 RepID=UPI0034CD1EE7
MSLDVDSETLDNIVLEEIAHRQNFEVSENGLEYILMQKAEYGQDTLQVIGEEVVVDNIKDECKDLSKYINSVVAQSQSSYDKMIGTSLETVSHSSSICPLTVKNKKWLPNYINKELSVALDVEENSSQLCTEIKTDDYESDEETIATFVTAAGQQLALYAVEDSEEIFAVAVYDETGNPPNNFQFLMKSDVERLIGEGAVRTVKKPTQIHKQTLSSQPPMFLPKQYGISRSTNNENKITIDIKKKREKNRILRKRPPSYLKANTDLESNFFYTSIDKHSEVTYLMVNSNSCDYGYSKNKHDIDDDNEVLQQSTVQYIFFESDQSESELTFDDIQSTLNNLKTESKGLQRNVIIKKEKENHETRKMFISNPEIDNFKSLNPLLLSQTVPLNSTNYECMSEITNLDMQNESTNNCSEVDHQLINGRNDLVKILSNSNNDINLTLCENHTQCLKTPMHQHFKTKRSRKQQLTTVNREDSEIIIQAADFLNIEDDNIRKKSKRKKKILPYKTYYKKLNKKRTGKIKPTEVEIIEIDNEEEYLDEQRRDIVEITLDDTKEKNSSDKENDVIMVRDSDEEVKDSNNQLSTNLCCVHCLKSFRLHRTLNTHLQICSQSPSYSVNLRLSEMKKPEILSEKCMKKEFTCRTCAEKFDAALVLARHVRSQHSQRKKNKLNNLVNNKSEDSLSPKPTRTKFLTTRPKQQINAKTNVSWKKKDLTCLDCGRWFPSCALLKAHCLQHATKNSDRFIGKCPICRKQTRSKSIFILHLQEHNKIKISKFVNKKNKTVRKIISTKKKGRPRKL